MEKEKQLYLYYDGACHLCSREINHYKGLDSQNKLGLIDISSPSFDPKKEGLSSYDFEKYFHVKTQGGEVLQGVKAFEAIWDCLGVMKPLSKLSKTRLGYAGMSTVYKFFAFVRPYLPKRKGVECKI